MPVATVLVPTHDHGPLLLHALRSVQEQTVRDIEIFVVGDGVPDVTRRLVAELAAGDPRITFFDNPKGARHGEPSRHEALSRARGEIVCYQSDDDLWRPGQVAELRSCLATADFAHTVALRVDPNGPLVPWLAALEAGVFRGLMHTGANFLPLSTVGHTVAAYRALPHGWRTTPAGTPTDLYMWQQFLEQPGIRLASSALPLVFNFATPDRKGWTLAERLVELEHWRGFMVHPTWMTELEPLVTERCAVAVDRLRSRLRRLEPLSGIARTRPFLGKIPRRLASELWQREVRRATVRLPASARVGR
jgi:glycosyltransferase involved in cell wall biosynthesis